MKKKNSKIILIIVFVVCFLLACFFVLKKIDNKKSTKDDRLALISGNSIVADDVFANNVIVQADDGSTRKVDIASGEIVDANDLEREVFSDFVGLPNTNSGNDQDFDQGVMISQDKSKALVTILEYGDLKISKTKNETRSLVSSQDYICEIAGKKCEKTEFLTQEYQGLDVNLQKDGNSFLWTAWNSKKNLLFGHVVSGEYGDISPVYVCDVQKKICNKTEGYDSKIVGNRRAKVPSGNLSPSYEKFAIVNLNDEPNIKTGEKWELLLYASDNPQSSIRAFDLSMIIDKGENVAYDSVHSMAWSGDEKKIAIGTARRIFLLDVKSGGLSLAYVAPTDENENFYWDNSRLFLSSDARSIAFVDAKDTILGVSSVGGENGDNFDEAIEDIDVSLNVLKKIDLEKSNQVSELLQGEGLSLK